MMYATYVPNQKFDSIRISVVRDIIKILKKSPMSKMSRTFILHNNSAEILLTNR